MPQYIMVCEGRSEVVYLRRLQSFLDAQAHGWDVPLKFIPKISANPDGEESGGGFFTNVIRCYKQQRKENKKQKIKVWVDDDIYVRQDSARERKNRDNYLGKPAGIPDFVFSSHNFEDFLALHLDDAAIRRWHTVFDPAHITKPLRSNDYLSLFETVIPGYRKGDLSPDFITRESLSRLKANLVRPLVPADPHFPNFAQFLIDQIETAFPELLTP